MIACYAAHRSSRRWSVRHQGSQASTPREVARVTLGVGPAFSGLPWHVRDDVEGNMVIHGRKRWALSRDIPTGMFNPRRPSWWWFRDLDRATVGASDDRVFTCVQEPGDVVYVPDGWYHTILNLEPTVVAAFRCLGEASRSTQPAVAARARSFPLFPMRLPMPGFTENLPWSAAMPWPPDTAARSARGLSLVAAGPGPAHTDPALATLLAAGGVGEAAAAVRAAREVLLADPFPRA